MDKEILYKFFCDKNNNLSSSKLKWNYIKQNDNIYNYIKQYFPNITDIDKPIDILYMIYFNITKQPLCPICGKKLHVLRFNKGFMSFCSEDCKYSEKGIYLTYEKTKKTFLNHYGTETPTKLEAVKQKQLKTNIAKYGVISTALNEDVKKKQKETLLKHYGTDITFNSPIIQNKVKQTFLKNYGTETPTKLPYIAEKIYNTKKKNNTFNTSKIEKQFYNYLKEKNYNFEIQYKSENYPFMCDFFIIDLNLYIELQGNWTHGNHPFDSNNIDDQNRLQHIQIKSEHSEFYKTAVNVWTIKDVNKRNIAIQKNLNYLEIFTSNIDNAKDALQKYIIQKKKYNVFIYDK